MFDLEQAIAAWREQMLAAGITSSNVDELESHLREQFKDLQRPGLDAPSAFATAVLHIGQPAALKHEFQKSSVLPAVSENLMILISALFFSLIMVLGTSAVFMCYSTIADRLTAALAMICILLVAYGWKFALPLLPRFATTPGRWLAMLACWAVGVGITALFRCYVMTRFETPDMHGLIPAIGFWTLSIGVAFFAIGLGLGMTSAERERFDTKKPARRMLTA